MVSPKRPGGRPPKIAIADIERAGVRLGLRALTVPAVAAELGVTTAALYRHVDGKFGLETLVGERILADLDLVDDPTHDVAEHLVSMAVQLREFLMAHPGLTTYVQVLFPRGRSGEALLAREVATLVARGCSPDAAVMAGTTVALLVISLTAAEESRREHSAHLEAIEERRQRALQSYVEQGMDQPEMDQDAYFRYVISSCLHGILHSTGVGGASDA